jgi:hypothetical protein
LIDKYLDELNIIWYSQRKLFSKFFYLNYILIFFIHFFFFCRKIIKELRKRFRVRRRWLYRKLSFFKFSLNFKSFTRIKYRLYFQWVDLCFSFNNRRENVVRKFRRFQSSRGLIIKWIRWASLSLTSFNRP